MTTLAHLHDCLLLDLDGTVFRGHEPTEGAIGALADTSSRTLFVTNNASRRAEEVADHLRDLGFTASAEDVVTSAQSAAHLLAQQLAPKSRVLVVGTDALAEEISTVGLTPVREFADEPVAVVQGHSVETGWPQLAEAALAIRAGALWVAANVDKTLPSERGLLPGNGSMVAALRTATDAVPQVAGKPAPALMNDALSRGTFKTPLVVGDRLDTDIAGANAAGLPSLMVLTGVNTARDAVFAVPEQRPTHLSETLTGLHAPAADLEVAENAAWRVTVSDGVATVTRAGAPVDDLAVVRAVARAVWDAQDGRVVSVRGDDDDAAAALARWALSD